MTLHCCLSGDHLRRPDLSSSDHSRRSQAAAWVRAHYQGRLHHHDHHIIITINTSIRIRAHYQSRLHHHDHHVTIITPLITRTLLQATIFYPQFKTFIVASCGKKTVAFLRDRQLCEIIVGHLLHSSPYYIACLCHFLETKGGRVVFQFLSDLSPIIV